MLKTSRAEMILRQNNKAIPVILSVGDNVLKRSPQRKNKLSPRFSGPIFITATLHGHKFKILDPKSSTTEIVHSDGLKKINVTSSSSA